MMKIDKHEELTEYGVYLKNQKNKSVAAIESELRRLSDASLTVVDKIEIKRMLINALTEFEFQH